MVRSVACTDGSDRSEHHNTDEPPATAAAAGTRPLPQFRCTDVLFPSDATASASIIEAGSTVPCENTPGFVATSTREPAIESGAFCQ